MLIPLGVLGMGAIFAGMIWYDVFFGDEAKLRAWFGMEAAAHSTEHGAAEGAEHGATEGAAMEGHAAPATEGAATEGHATTATEAPAEGHAAPTEGHAAVAPKGAIFLGPDNHMLHEAHAVPAWVKLSPFVAMVIGLVTAIWFYLISPGLPARLATQFRPIYLFLLNKWYFDELYDAVFVKPAQKIGRFLWKRGDGATIDGAINGLALGIIPMLTRAASRLQSGYIFHYAFAMVLGIAALITWMTLSGGAQ